MPAAKPGGRPRTICVRSCFNAMVYLLRSGCQWEMLPKSYPHPRTVWGYFAAWQKDGTWRRMHLRLRRLTRRLAQRQVQASAGSIDSQCVQRTQMSGPRGRDGGKQVRGRKRHIVDPLS